MLIHFLVSLSILLGLLQVLSVGLTLYGGLETKHLHVRVAGHFDFCHSFNARPMDFPLGFYDQISDLTDKDLILGDFSS